MTFFFFGLPKWPLNANIYGSCRVQRRREKKESLRKFPYCKQIEGLPTITFLD